MKINGAKRIIVCSSGKGGVGKSTFTVLLAHAFRSVGKTVSILDADITGSSIPLLLGSVDNNMYCNSIASGIVPADMNGFGVVSMALVNQDESAPILWESDYIAGIMSQILEDVTWNADILLIDVPPGSGTINRMIVQDVDNAEYLFITKSEEVVRHDVIKFINMVKYYGGDIVGIIENFATDNTAVTQKMMDEADVCLIGRVPVLELSGSMIMYDDMDTGFMDDIVEAIL